MRARAAGGNFFPNTTRRMLAEGYLCPVESEWKKKSLKYKKSEKLTFEISTLVKEWKIRFFFFEKCMLAAKELIFFLVPLKDAQRRVS